MWKGLVSLGASAAVVLTLMACEEDPVRPPISGDSPNQPGAGSRGGASGSRPSDGGTSTDAPTDGGSCSALVTGLNAVDQVAETGDPLAGTGGTILDGTYDLIEARLYLGLATGVSPGLTGTSYQGSVQVTGTTFERLTRTTNSSNSTSEVNQRGSILVSGSNGTLSFTCPTAVQEQITYSVLNSGSTLRITNLVTKEAYVFTRRS